MSFALIKESIDLPEPFTLSPTAEQERAIVLNQSRSVGPVTDAVSAAVAAAAGVILHRYAKQVNEDRLSLTRRLDRAKDMAIAIEDEHLKPILEEKERHAKALSDFREAEKQRVELAEQQRQAELQRLANERIEAEARAQRARTEKGQLKAELAAHTANQAWETVVRELPPEPIKAEGASTRRKLIWKCTDIHALYAARPDLCRIEPKAGAILAVCDPDRPVPGLEMHWGETTSFRS